MQLQIMSDLHLEFPGTLDLMPSFEQRAPYLALLGVSATATFKDLP